MFPEYLVFHDVSSMMPLEDTAHGSEMAIMSGWTHVPLSPTKVPPPSIAPPPPIAPNQHPLPTTAGPRKGHGVGYQLHYATSPPSPPCPKRSEGFEEGGLFTAAVAVTVAESVVYIEGVLDVFGLSPVPRGLVAGIDNGGQCCGQLLWKLARPSVGEAWAGLH